MKNKKAYQPPNVQLAVVFKDDVLAGSGDVLLNADDFERQFDFDRQQEYV